MPANVSREPRCGRRAEHAAAERGHVGGAVALLDRAGEEEQQAGDQAVGDVAEQGGVDARPG